MNVRRLFALLVLCFAFVTPAAFAISPNIVISQVYGGGGNSGATLKNDFIELYNRGNTTVNVTGWSVQYASSGGTTWTNSTTLSGSIAPGKYYLVQEAAGTGGTTNLPTPDAIGNIAMSASGAKVALVNNTTALSGTGCPFAASVVDFFGYDGANCFEGTATVPLTNTTAALRNGGGCTETDNNAADFTIGAPAPRNSATPATGPCGNTVPVINTPANPITTVLQNAAPFNVSLSGSDDNNIFNWGATAGTGVQSVTVASGQGTANITYTVTLVPNFTGTATFTATLTDNVNPAVTKPVNITVNAVVINNPPTITPPTNPITTVEENAPPFTVALNGNDDNSVYNWSAVAGTGVSLVSVTAGQGTNHATFTVTLQGGFSGTATFTASLSDNVNAPASTAVNITVTPPPPPPNHIVISQVYGGGGNTGATYQNDYVELYNPTASSVEVSGWTLQYQAATSTGNWSGIQPIGGTIGPGEYFLVALASGGAVGAPLPAANITGGPTTINMSATAGKIALVSNGDPLSNCPFGLDPDLVDLVGYGTTANCREGSSAAPGANNTTALFRKNSGQTDTDVNGADFVTGAPNPRRTAPIVEIGPFVVTVDPNNGASTAPRDASMTISFSEPVNVTGNWFDITCPSGTHNDATFANTDGGATWVITPNVNFTPGEVCTVTLFASNITDVDLDDSLPNTDTLRPGNKVWSFTVATGAAPPYTSDVHLTMGNPTNAVADTAFFNNYLMMKPAYALSYNRDKGTPNWVSWHLTNEWYGTLARVDTFRPDPAVPPDWYRVQAFDFFTTGFDRGHMTPNADRDNENRIPVNQETYLMSNMVPQAPDNNQGPWAALENFLRTLTDAGNELYIVSGPNGVGGTGSSGFMTSVADGHVTVPASTWKVVVVMPKADGNDVARVGACTRTIAVLMPNVQGIRNNDWHLYLTTVDAVETLTGYNFFSNVPEAIQNAIEAGADGVNPPGAANVSVATNEDVAKTFSFDAVSCAGGTLNFSTGTPSHGTLSGSGSSRTYTPAPDFNGTDSFTYTATDGSGTSNTATVNITVLEVNDPPSAANDAKSTDEDTPLNFAASDLTSNDGAGPANENGQTLTVASVTGDANTHGSVSLISGQVSYVPDANYNGPASFTYHVCDNGVTAGLADPLCADATVFVTVNSVNDPPTAFISAPATGVEGTSISVSGSATDIDDGESFTFAWTVTKNGSPYASGSGTPYSFTPDDNGTYVVTLTASDAHGGSGVAASSIDVSNVAPVITSVSGPTAPLALGTTASISVTYTDAGSADTHTATFTWDDGNTSSATCAAGTCTASHTYAATGVYGVSVVLSDDDGGTASGAFNYVVVYDAASGAFVTGGGFINSGAAKATFGFNAKYVDGQASGSTQFHGPSVNFSSTSYDWLVVAGTKAQVMGSGTISGAGDYAFLMTVVDDTTDRFRIKIWNKATNLVVYDSNPGAPDDIDSANPQPISGGNITIHH
jgi:endonuclease G